MAGVSRCIYALRAYCSPTSPIYQARTFSSTAQSFANRKGFVFSRVFRARWAVMLMVYHQEIQRALAIRLQRVDRWEVSGIRGGRRMSGEEARQVYFTPYSLQPLCESSSIIYIGSKIKPMPFEHPSLKNTKGPANLPTLSEVRLPKRSAVIMAFGRS